MKKNNGIKADVSSSKKPKWWKAPIESVGVACLCCGGTSEILEMETTLYWGVAGGWNILKNGQQFFCEDGDKEWDEFKQMKHIEEMIGEDNENEYVANFDSPLRDAKYQRHAKDNWVLIEKGMGFA